MIALTWKMDVLYYYSIVLMNCVSFISCNRGCSMALEGLQLGQYRLSHLLGSGGMGEVYLAEDARINQQVAIKVNRSEVSYYPNADSAQDGARLFQREARAIAKLDHPHILPLFGYGEELVNGMTLIYMVMPFRPEGSFADWLRQRNNEDVLSVQDVVYFISQAADALQYAHENQIVHQDVKPSNFLIRTNKGRSKLPDLLLAHDTFHSFPLPLFDLSPPVRKYQRACQATEHICTVKSLLAEATYLLSGDQATDCTTSD